MRRHILAGLLLCLPALCLATPLRAALSATPSSNCSAQAQYILHGLRQGSFNAERIAHFSPDMKAALAAQMNQFWSLLTTRFGPFRQARSAQTKIEGGTTTLILPLVFANGHENLHVTCNASGAVIGLFLTPVQKPPTLQPS